MVNCKYMKTIIKKEKDKMTNHNQVKKISFDSIVTPTTVEQFRDNLKKYYLNYLNPETNQTCLNTRDSYYFDKGINIDEISSLDDVYKKTKSGWYGSGKPFELISMCNISEKGLDYIEHSYPNIQTSIEYVMNDSKKTTLVELPPVQNLTPQNLREQLISTPINFKLFWVKSDNLIYKTFFVKTLGKFSGYSN